jgi:NADPH:quinone reductase-like Zn-dependent oxidoreductase
VRAVLRDRYGPPDVLEVREVDRPTIDENQLLVRVHAVSVNPQDWHQLTGTPYLMRMGEGLRRPKTQTLGTDYAGTVESVGAAVTQFQPGDEVFGLRGGAFAEYLAVGEEGSIVPKPGNVTFEDAAAAPVAALTALQGLRDKGCVQPGQRVLINGASGGVGTYAVQIAKALGAEVTGVCSTRNVDLVRSLGADTVIDYTKDDFTQQSRGYDVLLDVAGSRPLSNTTKVLRPQGILVLIGGPKTNRLLGPVARLMGVPFVAITGSRKLLLLLAKPGKEDMNRLRELFATGAMRSVIDRRYPVDQVADAMRYLGEGHAPGKVVLTMDA